VELWREISGSSGKYEISSHGRLRRGERVLAPRVHPKLGYVQCTLHLPEGKKYPLIHRLVATEFVGPIPPKYQVNHKNGNRSDNRVENLEIVTCSENNFHAYRELGREKPKGEKHPGAKLTEIDVLDIRWLFAMGVRQFILAKEYVLDPTVIRDIVHRYRWKHI
jgi:hypothetical protein